MAIWRVASVPSAVRMASITLSECREKAANDADQNEMR